MPLPRRARALPRISEVNARVAAVGRQLFTQQTGAIAVGAQKVMDAIAESEDAIKRSERLEKFMSGVSKFLKAADAVVDVASSSSDELQPRDWRPARRRATTRPTDGGRPASWVRQGACPAAGEHAQMGVFSFLFTRGAEDQGLLRLADKLQKGLVDQGFVMDEKRLPMRRPKLERSFADELARPGFRNASEAYRRRIVAGYWTITRFTSGVDSGLRSIFTTGSPNFMKIELMAKLSVAEDEVNGRVRRQRETARKRLEDAGLWTLVPADERAIWPSEEDVSPS